MGFKHRILTKSNNLNHLSSFHNFDDVPGWNTFHIMKKKNEKKMPASLPGKHKFLTESYSVLGKSSEPAAGAPRAAAALPGGSQPLPQPGPAGLQPAPAHPAQLQARPSGPHPRADVPLPGLGWPQPHRAA